MVTELRDFQVFKECAEHEMEDLAKICQKMTFKSGERIFEAGAPAKHFYVVVNGVVELYFTVAHYDAQREIILDRKCKGEAFGWSALTEPNTFTLSAMAVKETEVLRMRRQDLEELCQENNHLGYVLKKNIAEIIGERFTLIQRMLIDMVRQSIKEKEL